jgi:hypothetical protein
LPKAVTHQEDLEQLYELSGGCQADNGDLLGDFSETGEYDKTDPICDIISTVAVNRWHPWVGNGANHRLVKVIGSMSTESHPSTDDL